MWIYLGLIIFLSWRSSAKQIVNRTFFEFVVVCLNVTENTPSGMQSKHRPLEAHAVLILDKG